MESMLDAFSTVRRTTHCPFANAARVRTARAAVVGASGCDVKELAFDLRRYLEEFRQERQDGLVWTVTGAHASTLEGTVELFARCIAALADTDSTAEYGGWGSVTEPGWQFAFEGERLFLNVFSPCYPPGHTKHLDAEEGIVVFAQPEDAFGFCNVDSSRQDLKAEIRRRFANAGMPYSGALIDRRVEADLYVFPAEVDGEPVRWIDHPAIRRVRDRDAG